MGVEGFLERKRALGRGVQGLRLGYIRLRVEGLGYRV